MFICFGEYGLGTWNNRLDLGVKLYPGQLFSRRLHGYLWQNSICEVSSLSRIAELFSL